MQRYGRCVEQFFFFVCLFHVFCRECWLPTNLSLLSDSSRAFAPTTGRKEKRNEKKEKVFCFFVDRRNQVQAHFAACARSAVQHGNAISRDHVRRRGGFVDQGPVYGGKSHSEEEQRRGNLWRPEKEDWQKEGRRQRQKGRQVQEEEIEEEFFREFFH
jgi:hypothetical protein